MKLIHIFSALSLTLLAACSQEEPPIPADYAETDTLIATMLQNVADAPDLEIVADIDHSRLAAAEGAAMAPARVLIIGNPGLESMLVKKNRRLALDLPLRVLAYQGENGTHVTWNSFEYIKDRYKIEGTAGQRAGYNAQLDIVLDGIDPAYFKPFALDQMPSEGITHIDSPVDFAETKQRVLDAINGEEDAMIFGEVDFQAEAAELGIEIPPATLILFGAPAPGAKVMSKSPTLGLDGFCQKFLVWEGETGQVRLSYNDLQVLGERHGGGAVIPLKVITARMDKLFGEALAQ